MHFYVKTTENFKTYNFRTTNNKICKVGSKKEMKIGVKLMVTLG